MATQAEQAAALSAGGQAITRGVLRELFGAEWNPAILRIQFPDGSTGKFSNKAKMCTATGKYAYPFEVAVKPLEFPDAIADKSAVEVQTVERNARGEAIRQILPGEEVPVYTGDNAPAVIYGRSKDGSVKASVTGTNATKNPRKRVQMNSSRVEASSLDIEGDVDSEDGEE